MMTRLAEDVEVVDEVYEAVISGMRQRMQDKVPGVRMYAARSLSRLHTESDEENDPTVSIYRHALEFDRSAVSASGYYIFSPLSNFPSIFGSPMIFFCKCKCINVCVS